MAPVVAVVIVFLLSIACLIGGVYMLTGPGWALVASGVLLFVAGVALRDELKSNG